MGAFIISPLPPMLSKSSCAVRPLRSTDVTPFPRSYEPRRHRLAFGRFPGLTGYTTYLAPPISRWGEDGFSSCLACPCYRAVPTTPLEGCASPVSLRHTLLPSPRTRGLDLQSENYRGHLWVHSRYGPVTRSPSQGWLCRSASPASFPPRVRPNLRGSDFYPGGTVSH
jgi:hypothetical protein